MKIEIGEALGYSYLRHVKQCWLVQTNWKPSPHWPRFMDDAELEEMFAAMKQRFDDAEGKVFKQTSTAAQFLRQAEIDVLGVDQAGNVYALDVAFHEAGLNYSGETKTRVLKKLLRTVMIRRVYHSPKTQFHICFASPNVRPGAQKPLEAVFADLQAEYQDIQWDLLTNEAFAEQMVQLTRDKARAVADTSELFMRAVKLWELAFPSRTPKVVPQNCTASIETSREERGSLQRLVRDLVQTVLEDHPSLLDEADLHNLMDSDYCKNTLGLQIGNFPLLRKQADGRQGSATDTQDRYYLRAYAGRFYVCSQWWKAHHCANAKSLLQFVEELAQRKPGHPGAPALERHRQALRDYIRVTC